MSLVLDLPPDLESELTAEAVRLRLPLPELALRLLALGVPQTPIVRTGAQLLAYWQDEGLVGTRSDITDGPAHARALRQQAETRERP